MTEMTDPQPTGSHRHPDEEQRRRKMRYWIFSAVFLLGTAVSGYSQPSVSTAYGHVAWSPDGKLIAFTRMEITNSKPRKMVSDIFVSRPDGTEMRKLTGANGNESFPSF